MDIHRLVIHPRFCNFIVLASIVIMAAVSEYGTKVETNPCMECKLCVAACPVGANYKAAYCLAVCPAGTDVIGPYLQDRKGFTNSIVRPLQHKVETLYVSPGSRVNNLPSYNT